MIRRDSDPSAEAIQREAVRLCRGEEPRNLPRHYQLWATLFLSGESADSTPLSDAERQGLTVLLTAPRALDGRPQAEWEETRLLALRTVLGRERLSPHALLADIVLNDPSARVRELAIGALRADGSTALPALLRALKNGTNWRREGVQALIALLPQLDPQGQAQGGLSAALLTQVLADRLPRRSSRYTQNARRNVTAVMLVLLAGLALSVALPRTPIALVIACAIGIGVLHTQITRDGRSRIGSDERSARVDLHGSARDALLKLPDIRLLPQLLELSFGRPRRGGWSEARGVLKRLLWTVTPADAGSLSVAGDRLSDGLRTSEPDLTRAVLYAIEQIGSSRHIAPVRHLIRWSAVPELRDAARRILPVLEERLRAERTADTLVRAGEAPPDSAGTLLRPSIGHADPKPEELLRAETGEQ